MKGSIEQFSWALLDWGGSNRDPSPIVFEKHKLIKIYFFKKKKRKNPNPTFTLRFWILHFPFVRSFGKATSELKLRLRQILDSAELRHLISVQHVFFRCSKYKYKSKQILWGNAMRFIYPMYFISLLLSTIIYNKQTFNFQVSQPPTDSISSLSFSPKANFLVATSWDNQVSLFCVFVATSINEYEILRGTDL